MDDGGLVGRRIGRPRGVFVALRTARVEHQGPCELAFVFAYDELSALDRLLQKRIARMVFAVPVRVEGGMRHVGDHFVIKRGHLFEFFGARDTYACHVLLHFSAIVGFRAPCRALPSVNRSMRSYRPVLL